MSCHGVFSEETGCSPDKGKRTEVRILLSECCGQSVTFTGWNAAVVQFSFSSPHQSALLVILVSIMSPSLRGSHPPGSSGCWGVGDEAHDESLGSAVRQTKGGRRSKRREEFVAWAPTVGGGRTRKEKARDAGRREGGRRARV